MISNFCLSHYIEFIITSARPILFICQNNIPCYYLYFPIPETAAFSVLRAEEQASLIIFILSVAEQEGGS